MFWYCLIVCMCVCDVSLIGGKNIFDVFFIFLRRCALFCMLMELLCEFGEFGGFDVVVMVIDLWCDWEFCFGVKCVGMWCEVVECMSSCDVFRFGIVNVIDRTACYWNNVDKFVMLMCMFGVGCVDGELFVLLGLCFVLLVDLFCFGFVFFFDSATIGVTIGT